MSNSWRVSLLAAAAFAVAFHFATLSWNVLRPNAFTFSYTYPFFQQNWKLFVPPPGMNYRLCCAYRLNGEARSTELTETALSDHRSNPLRGREVVCNALFACMHYFEKDQSAKNAMVLRHCVNSYLGWLNGAPPADLKIYLLAFPVKSGQPRMIAVP